MNYTREPIIESIITPKEGCRLAVRSSKKGLGQEDYFVDAVEIVSFGNAIFFRSLERPKSFLVPVTDYEVIELKEAKMVLKSAGIEKSIKIGGGKEEEKPSKKRKGMKKQQEETEVIEHEAVVEKKESSVEEAQVSSSILRKLFPPPPNLIKEKLNHIKSTEKIEESISEELVKEEILEKPQPSLEEKLIEENPFEETEEKKEE